MLKVLIAEDEDIIRKGLIYTYEWSTSECIVIGEATDGQQAVELIAELKPDVLITDIRMPILDGLATIREGRKIHQFEAIILSGYSEFEYARQGIELDVTEYLLKPVENKKLAYALEKAANRIRKRTALETLPSQQPADIKQRVLRLGEILNRPTHSRYTAQAIHYIRENYAKKISLLDLADELDISAAHLNQTFKNDTSYTINVFINRYRIRKAVQLLVEGHQRVYEVAESCGFSDYKYFIQVFKKYVGSTPLKFSESVECTTSLPNPPVLAEDWEIEK